jgi:hypothetical protein
MGYARVGSSLLLRASRPWTFPGYSDAGSTCSPSLDRVLAPARRAHADRYTQTSQQRPEAHREPIVGILQPLRHGSSKRVQFAGRHQAVLIEEPAQLVCLRSPVPDQARAHPVHCLQILLLNRIHPS